MNEEELDITENEDIATSIASLSELAINKSLAAATKSFELFKTDIEARVDALVNIRPMLEIFFHSDNTEVKLSNRASKALPRLIINAKLGLYSLMVGPAGCGKTTAAYQVAEALSLQFGSVCLTAGASETWLFGRQTPTGFVEGTFSKIYREGGVFLADEMDAADANLLLSINTALSHSTMLNPMNGEAIKKHKDFVFIGAANTNGKGSTHLYTGRSRLDAATLDRMVVIKVDYDHILEKELCPDEEWYQALQNTREGLLREGHDEFVSTRAFASGYKQLEAGVLKTEILDSLVATWGDAARDIAVKSFKKVTNENKKKSYGVLKLRDSMIPVKWPGAKAVFPSSEISI